MESAGDAVAHLDELVAGSCGAECIEIAERTAVVAHTVKGLRLAAARHKQDSARQDRGRARRCATCRCASCACCWSAARMLARVAERVHAKLVNRHRHIFGKVQADSAGQVLQNWDQIKKAEEQGDGAGHLGDVPEVLAGAAVRLNASPAARPGCRTRRACADSVIIAAGGAGGGQDARGDVPRGRGRAVRGDERRGSWSSVYEELALSRRVVAAGAREGRRGVAQRNGRAWEALDTEANSVYVRARTLPGDEPIKSVHSRQILDFRGNATVEVIAALWRSRPRGRALRRLDR